MRDIISKGFLGTISPTIGVYISCLPEIEAWLRIVSLLVGIGVGCLSFVLLWMKLKRRYMTDDDSTKQ